MNFSLPLTEPMHIHSLDGKLKEATILKQLGENDFVAEYNGVKCHAIYNIFVDKFYVDDQDGIIEGRSTRQPDLER